MPGLTEVGSDTTTFGGVAHYLQSVYDSDLDWNWNGTTWSINATGKLAQNAFIDIAVVPNDGQSEILPQSLTNPDFCKNTLSNLESEYGFMTVEA